MHDHAMLDGFTSATEFQEPCTNRRVVHARQIAGQLLIGDAHGYSDCTELHPQELRVGTTNIRWIRKLHVLTRLQDLQCSRLQTRHRYAQLIRFALSQQLVFWRLARDEASEHGRSLFPNQLSVIVLIEFVELDQCPRQPGLATNLTWPQGAKQVNDLLSRNGYQVVAIDRQTRVTRMLAVKVIGHPTSKGIKLDAATNWVT